jgi:MFS family permease
MGALMIPQILSVIQVSFPAAERIKALAAFGITAGLGAVSGPLLGGLLITHSLFGLGWRSIFLINVPVGVIALVASARLVRESRAPRTPRLDPLGVLLLYPLVEGQQAGWPAWTYLMIALSGPALAAFVAYERIKTRRDGSPLVELRMFAQRGFAAGMAVAITFFLGVASFALVLTGAAARLEPKFGRGVTMSGALTMAAGMAALIGIVHHYGASVSTWDLTPGLALAGLGLGTVIALPARRGHNTPAKSV